MDERHNFLHLNDQLTEEERHIRDNTYRFVKSDVIPLMESAFEKGEFPEELIHKSAELGLFGMTLPEEYGGSNASSIAYGLVCEALEYGDSGLRSFVSVQSSLCMYPIFRYGTDEQKKQFLPKMAAGKLIGCFGLTEPDSGSDPASMSTTAKKVEGGWILNGSKLWITNASIAHLAIVWAKALNEKGELMDEGKGPAEAIRGFIVEKDFDGYSSSEIKHKLSLRASNTGGLTFQECFVPDSHFLPGTERGLGAPLSCLTQARYGIAWGAMGAAMACFDTALEYCKDRKQFNKPIASFQLVQKDFSNMFCEIMKAQQLNLRLGQLKDQEKVSPIMVSLAKMNSCREALNIARSCRNLLGANGISLEYPVIRHMANLESVFTYEGTDNVHHLIVGRHLTGLDAFS